MRGTRQRVRASPSTAPDASAVRPPPASGRASGAREGSSRMPRPQLLRSTPQSVEARRSLSPGFTLASIRDNSHDLVGARAGRGGDLQIVGSWGRRFEAAFENTNLGRWPQADRLVPIIGADEARAHGRRPGSICRVLQLSWSDARANRHALTRTRNSWHDGRLEPRRRCSCRLGDPGPPEPPEPVVWRSAKAPRVHRSREDDATCANGPLEYDGPLAPNNGRLNRSQHRCAWQAFPVHSDFGCTQWCARDRLDGDGAVNEDFVEFG